MGIFDMFQRKNNQPDPLTKIVETHPDFRTESHTVERLEADCIVSFAETIGACVFLTKKVVFLPASVACRWISPSGTTTTANRGTFTYY